MALQAVMNALILARASKINSMRPARTIGLLEGRVAADVDRRRSIRRGGIEGQRS